MPSSPRWDRHLTTLLCASQPIPLFSLIAALMACRFPPDKEPWPPHAVCKSAPLLLRTHKRPLDDAHRGLFSTPFSAHASWNAHGHLNLAMLGNCFVIIPAAKVWLWASACRTRSSTSTWSRQRIRPSSATRRVTGSSSPWPWPCLGIHTFSLRLWRRVLRLARCTPKLFHVRTLLPLRHRWHLQLRLPRRRRLCLRRRLQVLGWSTRSSRCRRAYRSCIRLLPLRPHRHVAIRVGFDLLRGNCVRPLRPILVTRYAYAKW